MAKKPTPEDIQLWKHHVKDVKPLSHEENAEEEDKSPSPKPKAREKKSKGTPLPKPPTQPYTLPKIPTLTRKQLRKVSYSSQIDLHGLTLNQAYDALHDFLSAAQQRGEKVVLVISGKGSLSTENTIRHQLPRWLESPPLNEFVAFIRHPAKIEDGGAGAFYVGIKKKR